MTETLTWRPDGPGTVWSETSSGTSFDETPGQVVAAPADTQWVCVSSSRVEVRWVLDSDQGHSDDGDSSPADLIEDLPRRLVEIYVDAAIRHARITQIEQGVWFASVAGLEGAWGDGETPPEAMQELRDALIGWVAVKRRLGLEIPTVDGHDLNLPSRIRPST